MFIIDKDGDEASKERYQEFENMIYIFSICGPCILAPLPLLVPPVFKRRIFRFCLELSLILANLICFLILAISGLGFMATAPRPKLIPFLLTLLFLEISIGQYGF